MTTPIEFDKPNLTLNNRWEVQSVKRDINDGKYFYLVGQKAFSGSVTNSTPILVAKLTDPYQTFFLTEVEAYKKLLDFHNYHGLDFPHWNELLALTTEFATFPIGSNKGIIDTGTRELELE